MDLWVQEQILKRRRNFSFKSVLIQTKCTYRDSNINHVSQLKLWHSLQAPAFPALKPDPSINVFGLFYCEWDIRNKSVTFWQSKRSSSSAGNRWKHKASSGCSHGSCTTSLLLLLQENQRSLKLTAFWLCATPAFHQQALSPLDCTHLPSGAKDR